MTKYGFLHTDNTVEIFTTEKRNIFKALRNLLIFPGVPALTIASIVVWAQNVSVTPTVFTVVCFILGFLGFCATAGIVIQIMLDSKDSRSQFSLKNLAFLKFFKIFKNKHIVDNFRYEFLAVIEKFTNYYSPYPTYNKIIKTYPAFHKDGTAMSYAEVQEFFNKFVQNKKDATDLSELKDLQSHLTGIEKDEIKDYFETLVKDIQSFNDLTENMYEGKLLSQNKSAQVDIDKKLYAALAKRQERLLQN